jgi:hypothetical protein
MAETKGFGRILERFWGFGFWGRTSEKGSSRKHIENWVTRWINCFWRNLTISR